MIEETYPSGRKVKNTLDADGALSLVETKPSGGSYATRAGSFTYNPAGAVTSMQFGNGHWESTVFNSRLQPTQIALGTTQNATDLLKLEYGYGTTDNNGNVLSQKITVPGVTHPFMQSYTYDALNRLESATETQNLSQTWAQKFTFDRYGNRNFDAPNTTTLGSCSAAVCNPTINASDNRIASGQGYSYDLAGNTTADAEGRQFTYDAENKQVLVKDAYSATIGTYFYDGDGKRVKKTSATSDNIIFIYNAAGKLVEERNASTGVLQTSYVYAGSRLLSTETSSVTSYLTNDHLGSPRINTDGSGTVTARHDYHPFGEVILRSGYGSDIIRKQFTGYERDSETGLDFAQARIFARQLARFSVPDPAMMSASVQNPQTWNRYAYVLNSPLKFSNPLGLWAVQRVVHKKTDDKGNETDQIDYVEFILVAEEGDDLNTLKEQFNLKNDKDASKLMESLKKNGMRLSKANNSNIKNVFKEMESIEKDYQQAILDKGVEAANDNGRDCSMTTSQISFGEMIRGTDAVKAFAEGDRPGVIRSERNPKDARTGDAVLWVKNHEPVHLATFLMFNRSGEPVVYSKTNSTGPYELKTTGDLTKENPNFGKVDKFYVGRP